MCECSAPWEGLYNTVICPADLTNCAHKGHKTRTQHHGTKIDEKGKAKIDIFTNNVPDTADMPRSRWRRKAHIPGFEFRQERCHINIDESTHPSDRFVHTENANELQTPLQAELGKLAKDIGSDIQALRECTAQLENKAEKNHLCT
ncbi:Hypothetical predicted protein [Pelobates cultripes]|uniref:Uncharacterized protein n=1 Tax=Pelobates cultripes TaxID=61616 RepID=A0AAD1T918_PELCU|nr:Hypothetical predicted protein [Pelobates cultripes]